MCREHLPITGSAWPGIRQLPAHQHHQGETEEQKNQAAEAVLDADDLVIGRENVFSPEPELVMLVFAGVVSADRDAFRQKQKNPFQEKVIISISRGKRGLQSRKTFSRTKNGTPAGSRLVAARTVARHRCSTISTSGLSEFPESRPCRNARCR